MLLRVTGSRGNPRANRAVSYRDMLELPGCESIETTVFRRSERRPLRRHMPAPRGDVWGAGEPATRGRRRERVVVQGAREGMGSRASTVFPKVFGIVVDWKEAASNTRSVGWFRTANWERRRRSWPSCVRRRKATADARHARETEEQVNFEVYSAVAI